MRNSMAKVPYPLRTDDMQKYEIWAYTEILIGAGIMCSCFIYTFVRALSRNRFIMSINTNAKITAIAKYKE